MEKEDINLDEVKIPDGLDSKQIERAKNYVQGTIIEGLSVAEALKKYGGSTATLYNDKHLKNPVFNRYVQALTGACVDTDEMADFWIIAGKIKANALKPNATPKDYELYLKTYSWLEDYTKKQKLEELGVTSNGDSRSVQEKKAVLLGRLTTKGDNK